MEPKTKKQTKTKEEMKETVSALDKLAARGRIFEGFVTKKFPRRVVIEFQRTVFVQKYERFFKKKTKLHARLPSVLESSINVGDYVRVRECRPLSKIIHFLVIEKVKSAGQLHGKEAKK